LLWCALVAQLRLDGRNLVLCPVDQLEIVAPLRSFLLLVNLGTVALDDRLRTVQLGNELPGLGVEKAHLFVEGTHSYEEGSVGILGRLDAESVVVGLVPQDHALEWTDGEEAVVDGVFPCDDVRILRVPLEFNQIEGVDSYRVDHLPVPAEVDPHHVLAVMLLNQGHQLAIVRESAALRCAPLGSSNSAHRLVSQVVDGDLVQKLGED
jgi:hypothetical protein